MSTMATNGIIYSPVSKMDISSLNEKALHALKYHQLLKLSSKYNIKKRWAKKDDLVKCLLAVKESLDASVETLDNSINEEIEWVDGKEALKLMAPPTQVNKGGCRSTFTIEKIDLDDSRATYNLQNSVNLFSGLDSRLTFDIPKKPAEAVVIKKNNPQVKKLTIPVTRTLNRSTGNQSKMLARETPLKMSNRSITIKKSKDAASPMKLARSVLSDKKKTSLSVSQGRITKTPVAAMTTRKENKAPTPSLRLSSRRKSKSDDPEARRRSALPLPVCSSSRTPPCGVVGKRGTAKPTEFMTGVKPITVTKMPNFAAIHQKQFSKMDSLDEYINKKSERVKKLFGTPMSSRPIEKAGFLSQTIKLDDVAEVASPSRVLKSKHTKTKLEEAKSIVNRKPHLQTRTEVKDRNRSHIHGIRSNRRFELQMKFRNI